MYPYRITATANGLDVTTPELLADAYGRLYTSSTAAEDAIGEVTELLAGLEGAPDYADIVFEVVRDDTLVDAVYASIGALSLPEGITANIVVAEDADGAIEAFVVQFLGLPGVTWADEVEDLVDLSDLGLAFRDSGGLGGGCILRGVRYAGGTYQRWDV